MYIDSKIVLDIVRLVIKFGKTIYKELENGDLSVGIMDGQVFIRGNLCGYKINHSAPLNKISNDIKAFSSAFAPLRP